jgi:hypothetical protein
VAFVRTEVSVENITSIIRVERILVLGTTSAVTSIWLITADLSRSWILSTLENEPTRSTGTSILSKPTRRHNPEYGVLHSELLFSVKLLSYVSSGRQHYCEPRRVYFQMLAKSVLQEQNQFYRVLDQLSEV